MITRCVPQLVDADWGLLNANATAWKLECCLSIRVCLLQHGLLLECGCTVKCSPGKVLSRV